MAETARTRKMRSVLEAHHLKLCAERFSQPFVSQIFQEEHHSESRIKVSLDKAVYDINHQFILEAQARYPDLGVYSHPKILSISLKNESFWLDEQMHICDYDEDDDLAFVKKVQQWGYPTERKGGQTHLLVKGDTLWGLAKRDYGSGLMWKKILHENIKELGINPNLIIAGTTLKIPALDLLPGQAAPRIAPKKPAPPSLAQKPAVKVSLPIIAAKIDIPVTYKFSIPTEFVMVEGQIKLSGEFVYQQKGSLLGSTKIGLAPAKRHIQGEFQKVIGGVEITYSIHPPSLKFSHTFYNQDGLSFKLDYQPPTTFTGTLGFKLDVLEGSAGILSFEGKMEVELTILPLLPAGAGVEMVKRAAAAIQQVFKVFTADHKVLALLNGGRLVFRLATLSKINPVMASAIKTWAVAYGFEVFDDLSKQQMKKIAP